MRSAGLAISLAFLPKLIDFAQNGHFTLAEFYELLRTLLVVTLIVVFNFIQRLNEKPPPRRKRRESIRKDHSV